MTFHSPSFDQYVSNDAPDHDASLLDSSGSWASGADRRPSVEELVEDVTAATGQGELQHEHGEGSSQVPANLPTHGTSNLNPNAVPFIPSPRPAPQYGAVHYHGPTNEAWTGSYPDSFPYDAASQAMGQTEMADAQILTHDWQWTNTYSLLGQASTRMPYPNTQAMPTINPANYSGQVIQAMSLYHSPPPPVPSVGFAITTNQGNSASFIPTSQGNSTSFIPTSQGNSASFIPANQEYSASLIPGSQERSASFIPTNQENPASFTPNNSVPMIMVTPERTVAEQPLRPMNVYGHPVNSPSSENMRSWNQAMYNPEDRMHSLTSPVAEPSRPRRGKKSSATLATSGRTFQCEVCSLSFDKEHLLKHHLRWHGPKPHPCGVCDKAFVALKDLRRHMKSHNKAERHFFCTFKGCVWCTKGFQRKDHLKRHMVSKHASNHPPPPPDVLSGTTFNEPPSYK